MRHRGLRRQPSTAGLRVLLGVLVLAMALALASCGGQKGDAIKEALTPSSSDQPPARERNPLPSEMPESFAFSLGFGVDAKNVLDVARGGQARFTRDPNLGEANATFKLTSEEMMAIYGRMRDLDFTLYPEDFDPPAQETSQGTLHVTPAQSYLLTVETGGLLHAVSWTDDDLSTDPSAIQLRDLIKYIVQLLESKSEYQALPPATGGYA